MGLNPEYIDGQTPLDEDEKEGLKIYTITTRGELDEFEQLSIEKAVEWSLKNRFKIDKILTERFIKVLHKRMFGEVWNWAGEFRKTNKNIGVDKFQIGIELKNLIDDSKYWLQNKIFFDDEFAVRFSHRVVKIHPFTNGNGRYSRLLGDIIINHGFNKPVYTWGVKDLVHKGEARTEYLKAIREADEGSYNRLIKFARK